MIKNYYTPVVKLSGFLKGKKITYKLFKSESGTVFHYPDAEVNAHILFLLTKEDCFRDLYNPLEFFNTLYELFELILKNVIKPEEVRKYLSGLGKRKTDALKHYFLLGSLHYLICSLNHSAWLLPPYLESDNEEVSKNLTNIALGLRDEICIIYEALLSDLKFEAESEGLIFKSDLFCFLPDEPSLFPGESILHKTEALSPIISEATSEDSRPRLEARSKRLYKELSKYGFFGLPKVKNLSDKGKRELIELISSGSMPYKIAMMNAVDFIAYLDKEYFETVKERDQEIMNWFKPGKDPREVRGNINSLIKPNSRYTSYSNVERVLSDLKSLK